MIGRAATRRLLAALTATLLASGCATAPPPRTEGSRPASHAQAGARLGQDAESRAAAFDGFMRQASSIDSRFVGPSDVADALASGAAYEPRAMEGGLIAYAALAALQEPHFVAAVRKTAPDARSRAALAARLAARPDLVDALPGSSLAAARARAALLREGEGLGVGGRKVKAASYSIQHQAWARKAVANPRGRLERVKAISAAGFRPGAEDGARLQSAVMQTGQRSGRTGPVIQRAVALAAISALGESGRGGVLMSEPKSGMCLRMAKLNLYQCLASAGPYYEDIYCLGQHAMIDPGQCVTDAAG